jgi:hypothetical protein
LKTRVFKDVRKLISFKNNRWKEMDKIYFGEGAGREK